MKVYYLIRESTRAIVLGKLRRIPRTYYLYIPDYNLELFGLRHFLPGYYDTEKGEFVVVLKGRNLEKHIGLWQVKRLEEIPSDAIPLEIEEKDIEKMIKAYQEWEKEEEKFAEELKEISPQLKALGRKTFKTESKPFEYHDKFSEVVEEIFSKYIDN